MGSFKNFLTEYDFSGNFANDIRHAHFPGVHAIERAVMSSGYSTNIPSMINLIAQKLLSPHVSLESFEGLERTNDATKTAFLNALKKISDNLEKFKSKTYLQSLKKDPELNGIVADVSHRQKISKDFTQAEKRACEKFGSTSNPQQRELYIKLMRGTAPDAVGEAFKNSIKVKVDSIGDSDGLPREDNLVKYIRVAYIRFSILHTRATALIAEMADLMGMVDASDTVNYDASTDPDANTNNTPQTNQPAQATAAASVAPSPAPAQTKP
jgi:hypothetical protein